MAWPVLLVAAVATGIPTLAYVTVVWVIDRYEKEPWHLLAATFLWGALPAAVLAVTLEVTLGTSLAFFGTAADEVRRSGLLAPIVEESVKGCALLLLLWRYHDEFNGILDGIIYGAVVGLGFAMTENFLAFARVFAVDTPSLGVELVMLRGMLFGLNHPLYAAIFGAGLGWARHRRDRPGRILVPALSFSMAVVLHHGHNVLAASDVLGGWTVALAGVLNWSGMILVAVLVLVCWAQERRWIEEGLSLEISPGFVTEREYVLVRGHLSRSVAEWRAARQNGWAGYRAVARHIQALIKLALVRYHLKHHHEHRATHLDLRRRRDEVRATRRRLLTLTHPWAGHPPQTRSRART